MTRRDSSFSGLTGATKVLAAVAVLVFGASLSPLHAQVMCGDTIGPGGNVQMLGDLSCGDDGITVVGPVNFNMKGFTLDCNGDSQAGITVEGEGAVVPNGTITDCDTGVLLDGTGGHQLLKLTARQNGSEGFHVNAGSDNNTFVGNTGTDNDSEGFNVRSNGNKLVDNLAMENNLQGIQIGGVDNRLVGNTAHDNDRAGFELDSVGTDNVLINNTATENGNSGFQSAGCWSREQRQTQNPSRYRKLICQLIPQTGRSVSAFPRTAN